MKVCIDPIVKQETNLVIVIDDVSLLYWHVINTAYHLGWQEPSFPSTKEFHGSFTTRFASGNYEICI